MVAMAPTQGPEDVQATVAKAVQEALHSQAGSYTPAPAPPTASYGALQQAPGPLYPVPQYYQSGPWRPRRLAGPRRRTGLTGGPEPCFCCVALIMLRLWKKRWKKSWEWCGLSQTRAFIHVRKIPSTKSAPSCTSSKDSNSKPHHQEKVWRREELEEGGRPRPTRCHNLHWPWRIKKPNPIEGVLSPLQVC